MKRWQRKERVRAWAGMLSILLLVSGLTQECVGQESVAPKSSNFGLPCLAPLLWEARNGAEPLAFEEAFFDGPFRRVGDADFDLRQGFPSFSRNPQNDESVKRLLDWGMMQLHAMQPRAAERVFREVVTRHPDCLLGYLGLALTNLERPRHARTFLDRAISLRAGADEQEQVWLEVVEAILARSGSESESPDWLGLMEASLLEDPEQIHLRAWMVRQLIWEHYRYGLKITSRLGVESLIADAEKRAPGFLLEHYRALLWMENPHAKVPLIQSSFPPQLGVIADGILAKYAMEAGRPLDAIEEWNRVVRTELTLVTENGIMPDAGGDIGGSWGALARGLSEQGRVEEALTEARKLCRLPWNPHAIGTRIWEKRPEDSCRREGQAALASILIRQNRWEELLDEVDSGLLQGADEKAGNSWRNLALLSLAGEGAGKRSKDLLPAYESWLLSKPGDEVSPPVIPEVGFDHYAELRMEQGRIDEATALSDLDLAEKGNSFHAKALRMRIDLAAGRNKAALFSFDRVFRETLSQADAPVRNHPGFQKLAEMAQLTDDWLQGDEAKPLPELVWKKPIAKAWKLSGEDGREISLSSYRGKPVVVIFFLGGGCPFCIEQLTKFLPWVQQYRDAGIELTSISTDPPLGKGGDVEPGNVASAVDMPFPILSDEALDVFRRYGVFDEFEGRPMHGTFLIDEEGSICWSDIAHEPFKDPEFLLREAQFLLDQGVTN